MYVQDQKIIKIDIPPTLQDPESVNKYFLSVFNKSNNCANKTAFYNSSKLNDGLSFSFSMQPPEIIKKYVYSIKSNAAGNDDLTLEMLKLSLPVVLNHLTHIVNSCLESGYFPK